jgi:SOS response regulatory protein OraA/RecX
LAILGVPAPIADRVLAEETGESSDPGVVRALARKRAAQLEGVERHDRIRRVVAFLARRGYAGPEVRRVVRETINQRT